MSDIQDAERELANQNFWANLRDRPDYIKYEFAKSVEKLDLYLGESVKVKLNLKTSPRENNRQNHNFFEDDSGLGNFIESLYDFHNEAIKDLIDILNGVYYDLSEKLESGAKYVWGILQGDFNDSPTLSQVIISGLISIIPIADQVSDIRDLVANILRLTDESERENKENWINLALTAFGLIPMVGSVIKTLIKVIRHNEVTDIHHLTRLMETCETYLRKIGAGDEIPWKDSPIHWLQTKPWQGYADKAKETIQKYLHRFSYELKDGYKNIPTPLQSKMTQLATQIDGIALQINKYIDEILEQTQSRIDELFAQHGLAMEGIKHEIHIGGNPNAPTKATHQQPSQKITIKTMPQKRVGCFNRVNTDKAKKQADENIKNDYPAGFGNSTSADDYLNRETDRQLQMQEAGINSLTVAEYEEGRKIFQARKASQGSGRGDGKDQDQTRKKFKADLLKRYTNEYKKTMPKSEAKQKAKTTTDNVMATLAALHNPDQLIDGNLNSKVPMDMGLKNVNSSIGSQWKNVPDDATIDLSDKGRTRVGAIDEAIKAIPESERANTRMNVKLERCK